MVRLQRLTECEVLTRMRPEFAVPTWGPRAQGPSEVHEAACRRHTAGWCRTSAVPIFPAAHLDAQLCKRPRSGYPWRVPTKYVHTLTGE